MTEFYRDNHATLYCQDFRQNDLPNESVQCVVTSPPYWGLRKYSGEQELIWGGKDCGHEWGSTTIKKIQPQRDNSGGLVDNRIDTRGQQAFTSGTATEINQGNFCSLCGAWKGAYGLEPTPKMYVEHTIEILRGIRRVLRKDGVVFWNIGDTYSTVSGGMEQLKKQGKDTPQYGAINYKFEGVSQSGKRNLKPKDLCLIPFRVAIAAQEDGWWVRSVIIWSKPNPMPESVTDRPTESHEYILMLTKSKTYYWDADAVRTPNLPSTIERHKYPVHIYGTKNGGSDRNDFGRDVQDTLNPSGRNIRSVWEFPTQPYPEAHFAVFPEKLPELCIKAATPEVGCCIKCGAPWERIVEKIPQNVRSHKLTKGKVKDAVDGNNPDMAVGGGFSRTGVQFEWEVKTLGWQPTCKCNADKVPSIVLDPFMGAGTTLWVAKKLNRKAIGYEISEEYCQLAVERIRQQVLL